MKSDKKISNNTTVLDDTVDEYNVISNLSACSVEKLDKNDVAWGNWFGKPPQALHLGL